MVNCSPTNEESCETLSYNGNRFFNSLGSNRIVGNGTSYCFQINIITQIGIASVEINSNLVIDNLSCLVLDLNICEFKPIGNVSFNTGDPFTTHISRLYEAVSTSGDIDFSKVDYIDMNPITSTKELQSYIGIQIPNYKESVIIDPDFSVLVDSYSASSKSDSICPSNSKLSATKIAGIIVWLLS
ncbi:hypothetical protein DICPUDRAFT_155550 [Dictyostelium purpureum]|uniref:Uncharacterized protein n=1 Tax=Dictyostelium purpureum TaxID=5786 RepID=F0ZUA9_DICPU|nr:uncharacterized protein DICPUDRAFT_155550 [Dictyostelium purpureum]EGC32466.1 hypothetical protein DICPUDRAFT_155550 [Dictyostelium purpureum]|eukprot:XP_003291000.1 hypothetical protein DICPUDRAFT_155550 [Dictyostelium purpureum]